MTAPYEIPSTHTNGHLPLDHTNTTTTHPGILAGPSTSPIATSTTTSGHTPSRRGKVRISRACTACSKVKLRCDGGQPCGRCASLQSESCTYLPSMRGKTRRKKSEGDGEDLHEPTGKERQKRPRKISVEADSQQWVNGKVMTDMKRDFAMWKQDEGWVQSGPRNASLWQNTTLNSPTRSKDTTRHVENDHDRGTPTDIIAPDKLTSLPLPGDAHNPLAVLAEASGHSAAAPHSPLRRAQSLMADQFARKTDGDTRNYYSPLARSLRDDAPHVMALISVHEAEQLFDTYFKHLHPHLPVLDREHSSPAALAQRNNFLFNSICCVSARAFDILLWDRLKEFARFEMERLPKEKNIDVVQGHLIYSVWNIITPTSFEQDKSWIRIGFAVRTAMDINVHRVALIKQAREGLPTWLVRMIMRTWLFTYIIDRTLSVQLGKPVTLRGENSVQVYCDLLRNEEERNMDDIWVASLAEWTQAISRVHDVFGSESADFPASRSIASQMPDFAFLFEDQFRQLTEKCINNAETHSGADPRAVEVVVANMGVYDHYARLVIHTFALHRAMDSKTDLPAAFAKYQMTAVRLINSFETDFEAKGLTRGCPDFIYVILTFAAVSLLKLTQPQFSHLDPDCKALLELARRAAGILARTATAADHLPSTQNVFLSRLIDARSQEQPQKHQQHPPPFLQPMDFEAFGQSIDQDLTKTPWPPPARGMAMSRDRSMKMADIGDPYAWLSGQPMPMSELALGVNLGGAQNADLLFTQDSFWKSLLESGPKGNI